VFHDRAFRAGGTIFWREDVEGAAVVKKLASRYASLLWLLAALSLVGWLIVNLDTAGWIIITLVVGLMAWQLTRRERRERSNRAEAERPKGHGVGDESAP
jgi:Flp pilus assembly protein TadB